MTYRAFVQNLLPIPSLPKMKTKRTRRPRGSGPYRRPTKSGFHRGDLVTYTAWNRELRTGTVVWISSYTSWDNAKKFQLKILLNHGVHDYATAENASLV